MHLADEISWMQPSALSRLLKCYLSNYSTSLSALSWMVRVGVPQEDTQLVVPQLSPRNNNRSNTIASEDRKCKAIPDKKIFIKSYRDHELKRRLTGQWPCLRLITYAAKNISLMVTEQCTLIS